ncbi:MAG: hypothetical protein QNJ46_07540 [Leptolyngbyaceae cyanobacterium MO_188.B28]|nr:hypothetical protein [Leptolyngbyaceae cyanobacterium MO_188.B28]
MAKQVQGQFNAPAKIGDQIVATLTQSEIAQLLDALFDILPSEIRSRELAPLQAETRQKMQQILAPLKSSGLPEISQAAPICHAKLAQTWAELWQVWDEIIWEATEEESRYLQQDISWETADFDSNAFIQDLEEVAASMQSLLQVAFYGKFSPDRGFAPALLEAETDISGTLPEWIKPVTEFSLDIHLTTCLLRWEWLTVLSEGKDAFHFARRIRQWEEQFSRIRLEDKTVLTFLKQLSETNQEVVIAGLAKNKESPLWKQSLASPNSYWRHFYLAVSKQ